MRVFGNLIENGLGCQVSRKKYEQTDNYLKFKTKDLVCFVDEWNIDSTKQIVIIKKPLKAVLDREYFWNLIHPNKWILFMDIYSARRAK